MTGFFNTRRLIYIWACLSLSPVHSLQYIGEQIQFFEDVNKEIPFQKVISLKDTDWKNTEARVPSFGFSNSNFWLRYRIDWEVMPKEPILEVNFAPVDYIEAFISTEDGIRTDQRGDRLTSLDNPPKATYSFDLSDLKKKEQYLYLKIKNHDGFFEALPLVLRSKSSYETYIQRSSLFYGIYYGILIVMIAYNLFLYLSIRDKSYILYVCYLVFFLSWASNYYGHLRAYFLSDSPYILNTMLILSLNSLTFFGAFFSYKFLRINSADGALYRSYKNALILSALFIPLPLITSYSNSVLLSPISWIPIIFFVFFSGVYRLTQGTKAARFFMAGWGTLAAAAVVILLKTLGLLPTNSFTNNIFQICSVIEVFLLSLALGDLINSEKSKNELLQQEKSELLFNQVSLVQKSLDQQLAKYNRIQSLSQQVQNTSDMENMRQTLGKVLFDEFNIPMFILYSVNNPKGQLEFHSLWSNLNYPDYVLDTLKKNHISLDQSMQSVHGKVVQKKRPLYLSRLPTANLEKAEEENKKTLKMTSLYILPLKMDNEVFAVFSMADVGQEISKQPASIKNLKKTERTDIELLGQYVSGVFYQSLQKELLDQSKQEIDRKNNQLERINSIVNLVQNANSFEDMLNNFKKILIEVYNVKSYFILIKNEMLPELYFYRIFHDYKFDKPAEKELHRSTLETDSKFGVHSMAYHRGRSVYLKRLRNFSTSPVENTLKDSLNMKSIYCIPLKSSGEVFATFSAADFGEETGVSKLSFKQKEELEQILVLLASPLYQALQKEQIQKAKDEAEQAQAAASRAKNEAAVNQLAAHLAHEVNNPLNYIATGKTMQNDSFSKYHEMILGVLSGDDEETKEFKTELDKLQKKFDQGMQQTNEGQDRITKVVAEIRAITGVDGLNFSTFDIVPIINEELVYSLHRNKIKIKEQAIKVRGTDNPIHVLSNSHILARSIRTVISNCVHFARTHKGDDGELYIDCNVRDNHLYMDIGSNSFSIKTAELEDLFDLEKSQAYGTEQIGLAMIKELLLKVKGNLVLADHGRESGKVRFQLQVPLES
jgi:signal transduction histidine kinase